MFSIDQLNVIRMTEIAETALHTLLRARVLEIGAGTEQQAQELQRRGFGVNAIELADSAYASARIFPSSTTMAPTFHSRTEALTLYSHRTPLNMCAILSAFMLKSAAC